MTTRILIGDVRERLRELADNSVHCCITSPPYYNLRDYGTAAWEGGDPACDHAFKPDAGATSAREGRTYPQGHPHRSCKCGATRVDRQIGLEETPAAFVAVMVEVFREVRRVLRDDGTLWLNLGDSYATAGGYNVNGKQGTNEGARARGRREQVSGFKSKDLLGIPWRVAFALQADGWWLRQDIIWAKPNPMPESVTDRCTKAHEYLFLLTKNARYHFDAAAIAEPSEYPNDDRKARSDVTDKRMPTDLVAGVRPGSATYPTRNRRSVWTIATHSFPESHFATFPPALIEPCILAGCPRDCCAKCGAPVVREVERTAAEVKSPASSYGNGAGRNDGGRSQLVGAATATLGWSPSCSCFGHWEERDGPADWISEETGERKKIRVYVPDGDAPPPVRGTVLDPFGGAGTTALVADRLGRDAILIELNPAYAEMARSRIKGDSPLFATVAA